MEGFLQFWQNLPGSVDPVLFTLGSFQIRYYSLMYIVGFLCTYILVVYRIRTEGYEYSTETIQDFFIWAILGLLLGARLGYVFFYDFGYFLEHPFEIILPFRRSDDGFIFTGISGLSYHGGALGVIVAAIVFCRRRKIAIFRFMDLFASVGALGYTFGRIGNFINGELYGRATNVPWGMYFPGDPEGLLRHPSQLYEALFEGLVLFFILWSLRRRPWPEGTILGLYVIGYGTVRFFLEFFREPDPHLGFLLGPFTMGQLLCLAMIAAGTVLMVILRARTSRN